MLSVDTNVLVRFLVRGDDPVQTAKAVGLFRENDVSIPLTVILEAEWVLRSNFKLSPGRVFHALEALAGLPRVRIQQSEAVVQAIGFAKLGLDFADALHLTTSDQDTEFLTFDRAFAKRATKLDARHVRAL